VKDHFVRRNEVWKWMDLHKEHVDDEGSIYLDNCVPCCQSCNSSKGNFKLEDWYNANSNRLAEGIFSAERLNKIYKWINEDYKIYIEPPKPIGKYTKKK
jgi:hypothetical protein